MPNIGVAVAVVSALTFTTRLAAADEGAADAKDRVTAFALSAGGTALSIGVMAAADSTGRFRLYGVGFFSLLVTPSAGEFYAGKKFTAGMGLRLGSLAVGLIAYDALENCSPPFACDGGAGLFLLGAIGYATGIIVDIATAGSAVDDYNQRLHVRLIPTVIPAASSRPAVGLGISGSF